MLQAPQTPHLAFPHQLKKRGHWNQGVSKYKLCLLEWVTQLLPWVFLSPVPDPEGESLACGSHLAALSLLLPVPPLIPGTGGIQGGCRH